MNFNLILSEFQDPNLRIHHEAAIDLSGATCQRATDYTKRPNVFRVKLTNGGEYLFHAKDEVNFKWLLYKYFLFHVFKNEVCDFIDASCMHSFHCFNTVISPSLKVIPVSTPVTIDRCIMHYEEFSCFIWKLSTNIQLSFLVLFI